MKTCNVEVNKQKCNCSYDPCSRKGVCCDCMTYHWKLGELPACFFPDDVEKTYNRSVEKFIETFQRRGRWW